MKVLSGHRVKLDFYSSHKQKISRLLAKNLVNLAISSQKNLHRICVKLLLKAAKLYVVTVFLEACFLQFWYYTENILAAKKWSNIIKVQALEIASQQ